MKYRPVAMRLRNKMNLVVKCFQTNELKSYYCYYGNKDSRLSTDADRVFGDLDHGAFQFHDDSADGWFTVRQLTSQLNVEIFIAVVTVWGEDVVAGGWQLNNVSIERLVMVVTPRTTNQLVVLWTQSWKHFLLCYNVANEKSTCSFDV